MIPVSEKELDELSAEELLAYIQKRKAQMIKDKLYRKQAPMPVIPQTEKPYELPKGWSWARLGDVGFIIGGGTPKTNISEFWAEEDGIPWVTPADLSGYMDKYISKGKRNITELGLNKSSAQLLPKGTVLFSSRAPIGYVAIAENDIATNQGFKSVVPVVEEMQDFLYWVLKYVGDSINSRATGTTFNEISGTQLAMEIIPLPPLQVQKHIAKRIELSDHMKRLLINTTQVQKIELKRYSQAILQEAMRGELVEQNLAEGTGQEFLDFIQTERKQERKRKKKQELPPVESDEVPYDIPTNWTWTRLGELSSFINGDRGKNYPSRSEFVDEGIPFINAGDISNNKIQKTKMSFISEEKFNILGSGKVQNTDILYCIRGTLGKMGIVKDIERGAIASSLVIIRPSNLNLTEYLFNYLKSPLAQKMISLYDNGSAQPNLSAENVKRYYIPLPPIAEQQRINQKLNRIMALCNQLEEELEKTKGEAEKWYQAVLQEVFRPKVENETKKT